ncbi:hypothetical protein BTA51_20430 [Hahella sp. CCB-MM4]|uniref:hypothetical protein n=1 Tax=Hahella sp. (strain CCB-MM4) TaxID=1926491 RepID=UPI000B9AD88F|nr:hypothetical protein [Hahella sp. CCB-MM4]OZG71645.1 hypothetical protein BTA51_20430 [Hahella sp. CCB-MM4]
MTDSTPPPDPAKEIARLTEELRQLREDVDSSYYRIPKQEFESITVRNITHDVTEHMNSKLATIRNWLGGGLLVFSFLGITQIGKILELETQKLASNLNTELDNRMDSELATINLEIANQTRQSELNQAESKVYLRQELARIEDQINSKAVLVERKQEDLESKMTNLFADVELAQSSIYRAELASIRDGLAKGYMDFKPARRQALSRLTPLLARVTKLQDSTLANEYLDELFRWTFQLGEYEKLDQYRVEYEENFEFNPTTWANIAIADMFLYEESGSPIYLQRALDANDKALQRLPSYGVPLAVRLILHAIEIDRAADEATKTQQVSDADTLLHQLNSGSNLITVYEAYDYLKQLESDHVASRYINKLHDYFSASLDTMEQGYTDYLISRGELPAAGEDGY